MKRALWIVTFAIFCTVSANGQTIADIARQERANRKNAPKAPTPTITNSRAAQAKGSEVSSAPAPVAEATAATKPAESAQLPEAPKDARNEEWWRNEFDKARVDLRRAENQAAVAQLELNAANRDYLTRSFDPDGRGPAAIGAATARLDAAQRNVEQARGKIGGLEEELRRAGAPAGWGR
jgi:hypothetical protein